MCSYVTVKTEVEGGGKGAEGWFRLSHANVYLDHPFFTQLEHTLNIDFVDEKAGSRVAVELSPESARALLRSIESALASSSELIKP